MKEKPCINHNLKINIIHFFNNIYHVNPYLITYLFYPKSYQELYNAGLGTCNRMLYLYY